MAKSKESAANLNERIQIARGKINNAHKTIRALVSERQARAQAYDRAIIEEDAEEAALIQRELDGIMEKMRPLERKSQLLEGKIAELSNPARQDRATLNDLLDSMKNRASDYNDLMSRLNELAPLLFDIAKEAGKIGQEVQTNLSRFREAHRRLTQGGIEIEMFQSFDELGYNFNPIDIGRIRDAIIDRLERMFKADNYRFQKIGK